MKTVHATAIARMYDTEYSRTETEMTSDLPAANLGELVADCLQKTIYTLSDEERFNIHYHAFTILIHFELKRDRSAK